MDIEESLQKPSRRVKLNPNLEDRFLGGGSTRGQLVPIELSRKMSFGPDNSLSPSEKTSMQSSQKPFSLFSSQNQHSFFDSSNTIIDNGGMNIECPKSQPQPLSFNPFYPNRRHFCLKGPHTLNAPHNAAPPPTRRGRPHPQPRPPIPSQPIFTGPSTLPNH